MGSGGTELLVLEYVAVVRAFVTKSGHPHRMAFIETL
jgi:hypothetical protein